MPHTWSLRTAGARGRGRPVWLHLTGLVSAPLAAAALLATALLGHGAGDLDGARTAQGQLLAAQQIDTVRRAVDAELLPTLVLRTAQDAVLSRRAGLLAADGTDLGRAALLRQAPADLVRARAAVDLAAVQLTSPTAAQAVRVALDQLTALRADSDRGLHGVGALADDYRYVGDVLVVAEREAFTEAAGTGLTRRSAPAVSDVEHTVELATSASRQLPAALVAVVTTGDERSAALTRWRATSGDLERLDDPDQEPLVHALQQRWHAAAHSPAAVALSEQLSPGWSADTTSPAHLAGRQLLALRALTAQRDAELTALVDASLDLAERAVTEDADEAQRSQRSTIALTGLALLLGAGATVLLVRSLSRSLRHLGGAARDLQDGRLVRDTPDGPREVREVGRALGSASRGLHRVRQQVEAVTAGDLERAAALPAVPGLLGGAVHASVASLVRAVRTRDALRAELAHRAEHDPLTGLPNRAAAVAAVEALVERSRSTGEQVAVFFVDLDGFKAVNDGCGHAAGDALLQEVALRLRHGVREEDLVGRLGGDEFVVVMADIGVADALVVAERLVGLVAAPVLVPVGDDVRERAVGASIGVALARAGSVPSEALVHRADTAVYRAKASGRGRVVLFDEALRAEVEARQLLERDLRSALAEGAVGARWEPQVRGPQRDLVGHRAAPAWHHRGQPVAPAEVLRAAEAAGLGRELGLALLARAVPRLAAREPRADGWGFTVVPLTERHVADPAVVEDVLEAVAAARVPHAAGGLFLQTSERVLADPGARANLHALRAAGLCVGVITEGLTPLHEMPATPVDVVVLAADLTRQGHHREQVCRLVAGAATAVGTLVVAEGVTSEEQAARLLGLGAVGLCGPLVDALHPAAAGAGVSAPG